MKFDKETIIGLVICTILLFAWPTIVTKIWGPPPEKQEELIESPEKDPTNNPENPNKNESPAVNPQKIPEAPEKKTEVKETPEKKNLDKKAADKPNIIIPPGTKKLSKVDLENDFIKVTIDPNEGKVSAILLKKYFTSDPVSFKKTEDNIVLFKKFTDGALGVTADEEWILENIQLQTKELGTPNALVNLIREFKTKENAKFSITQTWQIKENYSLNYNLKITNLTDTPLNLDDLKISIGGLPNIHELAYDKAPFRENHEISYCEPNSGKVISRTAAPSNGFFGFFKVILGMAPKNPPQKAFEEKLQVNANWLGVANKYFTCMLVPEKPFTSGIIRRVTVHKKEKPEKNINELLVAEADALVEVKDLPAETDLKLNFEYFTGPKKIGLLEKLDANAPKIMKLYILGMSFFEFISRIMLSALLYLQNLCGSYGLSIIMLTLIVKTLLWPVTHKANTSMRKMQRINPLIQEIRKKYKDDPQKINMEMMKLYKEHKVNPLGGCLPILLQMPVFFALYAALSGAIEPRHTAFLWINDLTLPDTVGHLFGIPINPLMITMSSTMLLQQKLTPSAADPAQQRMMMFMPLLMLVMLYSLPSGLTLYWTVSQLISIGQLIVNKKLEQRAEAAEAK